VGPVSGKSTPIALIARGAVRTGARSRTHSAHPQSVLSEWRDWDTAHALARRSGSWGPEIAPSVCAPSHNFQRVIRQRPRQG